MVLNALEGKVEGLSLRRGFPLPLLHRTWLRKGIPGLFQIGRDSISHVALIGGGEPNTKLNSNHQSRIPPSNCPNRFVTNTRNRGNLLRY